VLLLLGRRRFIQAVGLKVGFVVLDQSFARVLSRPLGQPLGCEVAHVVGGRVDVTHRVQGVASHLRQRLTIPAHATQ
jgi:hypothetical protein